MRVRIRSAGAGEVRAWGVVATPEGAEVDLGRDTVAALEGDARVIVEPAAPPAAPASPPRPRRQPKP